jgi:hypothetical protein
VIRKILTVLVALGVGYVFLCAALGFWISGGPSYDVARSPFDREVWLRHADVNEKSNPRRAMLADVAARLAAPGLRRKDVIELLGAPTQDRGSELVYVCGWDGAFAMDTWNFVVRLDPDGRVHGTSAHQG